MDKTMVLDLVFKEIERIKQEANFHTAGEIYQVLADLQAFILTLKTTYI